MMFRNLDDIVPELVRLRTKSGKTQKQIAEAMGIKQPQVSAIESGKKDLELSTLQRYYRAVTGETLRISVTRVIHVEIDSRKPNTRTDFAISA